MLQHYRLAFPRYEEYWGGGVADIIEEPGKSVFGALIHISVPTFKLLEQMHDRRTDEHGREIGRSFVGLKRGRETPCGISLTVMT